MNRHHPDIGTVQAMPRHILQKKTWRHFYSPVEDWGALSGANVPALYNAARVRGCPKWKETHKYPPFPSTCADTMRAHHHDWYVHAYMRELVDPETRCGRSLETGRWVLCSDNGVYLVVIASEQPFVLTAYRPHYRGLRVPPSRGHYRTRAQRRWTKETGMQFRADLTEDLQRTPDSVEGVWLLALAISEAQAIGDAALESLLAAARQRLYAAPAALKSAAQPAQPPLLDALEAVVRGDEPDAAGVLLELEEALSVTEVLKGATAAESLLASLQPLVDWAPAEWSRMADLFAHRAAATSGGAHAFWNALDAAVISATLASAPAARPQASTLAARLVRQRAARQNAWLPERGRVLLGQIRGLTRPTPAPIAALLKSFTSGATAPTMGSSESAPPWSIRSGNAPCPDGTRVFIVDAEYPGGYEVTAYLDGTAADLWNLETPGQQAVVVVVSGASTNGDLATLLARFDEAEMSVVFVEFSRPR